MTPEHINRAPVTTGSCFRQRAHLALVQTVPCHAGMSEWIPLLPAATKV